MSQLTTGVDFNLGDGWLYAQESLTTPNAPGDFTANPVFPLDKNGDYFETNTEYRLWAMRPVLQPDPVLYVFRVNDNFEVVVIYGPAIGGSNTGSGSGTPATSSETLDSVGGRSDFAQTQINPDYLATYQPHPLTAGKVIVRGIGWASIWMKLISLLSGDILTAFRSALSLRLRDLTERATTGDIFIENGGGAGSFIVLTDGSNQRGLTVLKNGQIHFHAGQYADGAVGISDANGNRIGMTGLDIFMAANRLAAPEVNAIFRTAALKVAPLATAPSGVLVGQYEPGQGNIDIKQRGLPQLAGDLQPYLDIEDIANRVRPLLTGETIPGDARAVLAIFCRETPVPPQTEQYITFLPNMLGIAQSHNLQVDESLIWPELIGPNNRDALAYMTLTFTGTTSVTLTAEDSDAAGGTYRLKLLKTP